MDVQFTEEATVNHASQAAQQPKGLMKLVISSGLAKDKVSAQKVLLVILVLAIVANIAVLQFGRSGSIELPPPEVFNNM